MSRTDQAPQLPVLPRAYARRAAARRITTVIPRPRPANQVSKQFMGGDNCSQALGLAALVSFAVAVMTSMVIFSIVRDKAALSQPPAPIVAPLHP